jgi:hypothetical protein
MKIVCAWCGKPMGEKPPYEDESITHSICPECYEEVMGEPYPITGISNGTSSMGAVIFGLLAAAIVGFGLLWKKTKGFK